MNIETRLKKIEDRLVVSEHEEETIIHGPKYSGETEEAYQGRIHAPGWHKLTNMVTGEAEYRYITKSDKIAARAKVNFDNVIIYDLEIPGDADAILAKFEAKYPEFQGTAVLLPHNSRAAKLKK
jgi:hypothetical protein